MAYLQEHYDLRRVSMTGASAGAVAAACAATNIDVHEFVHRTIEKAEEVNLWKRRLGLIGVLGEITHDVLDQMLPDDSADKLAEHNVSILLKPMTIGLNESVEKVSEFKSRQSVINALTATSHIPWLANGRALSKYNGKAYIDGALFSSENDFINRECDAPVIKIDFTKDPTMMDKNLLACVQTPTVEELWEMLDNGFIFGAYLDDQGTFKCMQRCQKQYA